MFTGLSNRFPLGLSTNSYRYLKDDRLVVFLEVESEHVSVFQCVSAQTQNIYSFSKKLDLKKKAHKTFKPAFLLKETESVNKIGEDTNLNP